MDEENLADEVNLSPLKKLEAQSDTFNFPAKRKDFSNCDCSQGETALFTAAVRGLFNRWQIDGKPPADSAGITVAKLQGEGEDGRVRRGRSDDRAKGGTLLSVYYS